MNKTIIEEVHEWASKQAIVLPLSKEFVGEIIERGNQEVLREYAKLHKAHIDLEQDASALVNMLMEEEKGNELMFRGNKCLKN